MDIPKEKLSNLESFFKGIPTRLTDQYLSYWSKQIPKSSRERWQKWIFAAASIHTGWENNVAQYKALKNIKGKINQKTIATKIKSGGMQNRKAKLIGSICDTKAYEYLPPNQDWLYWRDYHRDNLWGIGNAKISFVAELLEPTSTNIICIDRHILDAFGQNKEKAPPLHEYLEMEDIWKYLSLKAKIPPAISRFIYWDVWIQNKPNSKYWSKILENE